MPKRTKDSNFYNHPFLQKLPKDGKLLYDYLLFNSHVESSGLYKITLESMAFETGIDAKEIPDLIGLLIPNVAWYPEHNIIWVKEFLSRQYRSKTFLVAVARCLRDLGSYNGIVDEYLAYNKKHHGFDIPYGLLPTPPVKAPEKPPEKVPAPIPPLDEEVARMVQLYESELGKPCTPTAFEDIKFVEDTYPAGWFDEAVQEAKNANARSPIKYIMEVLRNKEKADEQPEPVPAGEDSGGMEDL